jgi:hypothetical protein
MKKIPKYPSIAILSCFLWLCLSMKQSSNSSSLTANFNGTAWHCTQLGATVQSYNGYTTLMIHAQNPPTAAGKIEYTSFTISSYTGAGTYAYGNKDDKGSLKITYQDVSYSSNPKLNGGGSGTIKITEYVKPTSPGKMGKIVGEITGTLKFGNKTLTIANGKFNSTAVL